jgi:hypothetical protein
MESVGSALKGIVPELAVSKQKLRHAEGSCIVRLKVRKENRTWDSVRDRSSRVVCRFGSRRTTRCCTNAETATSFCRSPAIQAMG